LIHFYKRNKISKWIRSSESLETFELCANPQVELSFLSVENVIKI